MDTLKRIGGVLSSVIVVIAVVLAVSLVGVRLLGFETFTVLSGSMEPTYKTGSVIWVKKCDTSKVDVGDPITFVLNENLDVATHRVVAINSEAGEFTTKGDANDAVDGSPVLFENLIGTPVFAIPYLGYALSYIQGPPGCYVALIVALAALVLMLIPEFFDKCEKRIAAHTQTQRTTSSHVQDVARARAQRTTLSIPRGARQAYSGSSVHDVSQNGVHLVRHNATLGTTHHVPNHSHFSQLTPEEKTLYAQRELERRRAMRAAQSQGISLDSYTKQDASVFERKETK